MSNIKLYPNSSSVNDFLLELVNENKSDQTVKAYSHDLHLFFQFISNKMNVEIEKISVNDIKNITKSDITAFLIKESNLSASSKSRHVSSIKGFFKYMLDNKLISENPSELIKKPKIEKTLPKYLSLDEAKQLLNTVKNNDGKNRNIERDFAIITIFLNCGLRLNELVNLDLNSIKDGVVKVFGKGAKERKIALNDACIKALDSYLKTRNDKETALFLSENKARIGERRVQEVVKGYLSDIGCGDLSTHKTRHSFASIMFQNGVDIRDLQTILGHSSITSTSIYTHCNNDNQKKIMNNNPLNF